MFGVLPVSEGMLFIKYLFTICFTYNMIFFPYQRSRYPRERLVADEFEQRQAWYRESHAWFQNPTSLRPPKKVRRVPEVGDPSDDDDDDDAPPRDDPYEAEPSHHPMDWDPYEQK